MHAQVPCLERAPERGDEHLEVRDALRALCEGLGSLSLFGLPALVEFLLVVGMLLVQGVDESLCGCIVDESLLDAHSLVVRLEKWRKVSAHDAGSHVIANAMRRSIASPPPPIVEMPAPA